MRIVFMGNAEFAIPSLEKVSDNFEVVGVISSPDKPQGRGLKLTSLPVKEAALKRKLPTFTVYDLKSQEFYNLLKELNPDLFVVVAFRILPENIITLPSSGTINLHPSLLPKYRGAAPIQWALIKGERETGVSTFLIEKKVDAGKIISQKKVEILPEETCGELSLRLSVIGSELLVETINLVKEGQVAGIPQDEGLVSYAPKIKKENCRIDWNKPAVQIKNLVRGLSPQPGAFTTYKGKILKIFKTAVLNENDFSDNSGEILKADDREGMIVKTSRGCLKLIELQPESRRIMNAAEFVRGHKISPGERLI